MVQPHQPAGPARLDRSRYEPTFVEDFADRALEPGRWLAHYLPHWTTPERSAARYALTDQGLRLRIDAGQPAWRPEDGQMRVSNLQTGSFSGPLGSSAGQHRHRPDLRVVTPQPTRRLFTPSAGLVEARMRASADPSCMLALWLVGLEVGGPEQSGEICLAELFGSTVGPDRPTVRLGVKAHHDPRLRDDVHDVELDLDTSQGHGYAAAWDAHRERFYVDDMLVHTAEQGLDYPLQLMVDLFEFPVGEERDPAAYPKQALVREVRGWRPRG
jgi:hypothetical protein